MNEFTRRLLAAGWSTDPPSALRMVLMEFAGTKQYIPADIDRDKRAQAVSYLLQAGACRAEAKRILARHLEVSERHAGRIISQVMSEMPGKLDASAPRNPDEVQPIVDEPRTAR